MISVFVYGTLRPGGKLHRLIESATEESFPAKTNGAIYHVRAGTDEKPIYPVANFKEPGTIFGDVLLVDGSSADFQYVDEMETSSGYRRILIEVEDRDGDTHKALAYEYDGLYGPKIESGEWL